MGAGAVVRGDEIDLKNFVFCSAEASLLVGFPGASVVRFHVEAQAADIGLLFGQGLNMAIERSKYSIATKLFRDINALDPPKIPVPPITPFVRDEQLACDFTIYLRDIVRASRGVAQESGHSGEYAIRIQTPFLGFPSDPGIEIGDNRGIAWCSSSDDGIDGP